MQLWFDATAFLVDLFRKVDSPRAIKDRGELALMTEAQRIAGLGMDRARELLRPGVAAHEVAPEALYAMMRADAERTSTPLYVNFGIEACMLHGRQSPKPLERGELALIGLH